MVAGPGDGGGQVGLDLAVQAGQQVQGDGGVVEAVGGGVASGQGRQGVCQDVSGVAVEGRADVVVTVRDAIAVSSLIRLVGVRDIPERRGPS